MEGKKVPPSLCCCTAEEEEEEEGDLISSPSSPPFPFPAALEVDISPPPPPNPFFPSTTWAGEFPPFPPSHFVTIFSLPSLEWKLMTLSRSPSQSQTEKLSNSKSSNPFFLLFNFFLFDRGFFFLCRRQRMA